MARERILFIAHNHPKVRPGGAEGYAYELFTALRSSPDLEPTFLCKGGPPLSPVRHSHPGTRLMSVDGAADEYFVFNEDYEFDLLFGTIKNKEFYTKHFRSFLRAIQPSIVHIQHTLHLGYDLIREIRNTLPDAIVVYTLHEFMPICHRTGQMVRTVGGELCDEESPRRCHECFPDVAQQDFFLRKRFIQAHFDLVDVFIAPSEQLRQKYIRWGLDPSRIVSEEYGRLPTRAAGVDNRRSRNNFAFFGQLSAFKGVDVVLDAMSILAKDRPGGRMRTRADALLREFDGPEAEVPHLWLHGANLDFQEGSFQNYVREMLNDLSDTVTFGGKYEPRSLPALMEQIDWVVVPSIWWENSPLVIQEAFAHGRPVICSDVGGMAEKVTHDVNGLHFRAGDATHLADTIRTAATDLALWERLRDGIPPVHQMDDHIARLLALYDAARNRRKELAGGGAT